MKAKQTSKKRNMKKQNYLKVASSAMMLSAMASNMSFVEAQASNPKQTITFDNNLSQNQSKTITVPNLVRIVNVTSNTGNVNYTVNGEQVTINVSGGTPTETQYNPTKHSKSVTNFLQNSTNVFPGTNPYSDANGYSGTLNKNGASIIVSGSYSLEETKTVTDFIEQTSNSFPATKSYNSGGFTGTLTKSGSVTSRQVETGGYYQQTGYYEDTGYWESTGYWDETTYWVSDGHWETVYDCTWDDVYEYEVCGGGQQVWIEDGYYDTRSVWVDTGRTWVSTGQRWVSTGQTWVPTYTTYYRQNYSGTVTKPSVDTKTVTDSIEQTSNSFPDTKSYSKDGYTGTLTKSGSVTTRQVETGGYWQDGGYWDETTYWVSDGHWETVYDCTWDDVQGYEVCGGGQQVWVEDGYYETKTFWVSDRHWVPSYTVYYTQNYSGTVTKAVSDTRVYQQNYSGTVYKGENENLYGYEVTIEYVTDSTPPTPATFSPSTKSPTNKDVTVDINYPSDAKVKQYKVGTGGIWSTYSSAIVLSANNTIYARSFDEAGNVSEESSYVVNNIDKTPPAMATLTPSTTSPTNQNVTVTVSYPSDASTKQYKVGATGSWTSYTAPVSVSANDKVYVRSYDVAGNVSAESSLVINNIDKVLPSMPVINADVRQNTFVLTNMTDSGSGVKETQYKIDSGSWTKYTSAVSLSDGQHTIQVKTIDVAGNQSAVTTQTHDFYKTRLASATTAVAKAETSKLQSDVDSAKSLVNGLPSSDDKATLTLRVTEVQNQINAKNAVDKAEKTDKLSDWEFAKEQVALVQNPTVKSELNERLQEQEQYIKRVQKVESLSKKAETTLLQVDVDAVKTPLSELETDDRPDFQNRIDDVQGVIDVQFAVQKALTTRSEADVVNAQTKISLLNNSNPVVVNVLDDIQAELEVADILVLVTKERYDTLSSKYGVSKVAYNSLVQSYYAIKYTGDSMYKLAKDKFALVPTNDKHYALVDEQFSNLDVDYDEFVEERVQSDAEIKAESSVKVMEASYDPSHAVNTQALIDKVEDATVRESLQKRLDDAKTKYETSQLDKASQSAMLAVEKAESTKQTYYVSEAYKRVNALTEQTLKSDLTARLQELESQMALERKISDATRTVELAEQYKYASYITSAQTKVTALPNGDVKTALQQRLDTLKAGLQASDQATMIKQATNYVSLAQSLKTQYYVDKAQGYVDQILDVVKKAELQAKLDAIVVK